MKPKHADKVIPFANEYNHIAPFDLEEIMETLEDWSFLSEEGKAFRTSFWKLFIKSTEE